MTDILDALQNADIMVWASPVYYFSVTAQLKATTDRCYPLINENAKQTVLLLTCADQCSETDEGALAIYRKTVQYYKWIDAGTIIATGVEQIGDIAGHYALVEARKLGLDI
jgi:multimeric flavodoxin WrbA